MASLTGESLEIFAEMTEPDVVALGGGHGLAVTIRAVRRYASRITAVVATADDGGSTGRLRSGMHIPAPGDLRRCLVAMTGADEQSVTQVEALSRNLLAEALEYRFAGTDVEGHALGNLLLAGLGAVTGDFVEATDEVSRLLGLDPAEARVLPATVEPVELCATTADGAQVSGQVAVSRNKLIEQVRLEPPGAVAPAGVAEAIRNADQIVLGPGSLYTSVLAAVIVDEVREALARTRARRVYVCNLRAETTETRDYDVGRHVEALWAHGIHPEVVLVDTDSPLLLGGLASSRRNGIEVVPADVARPHGLAHDSAKLALALAALVA